MPRSTSCRIPRCAPTVVIVKHAILRVRPRHPGEAYAAALPRQRSAFADHRAQRPLDEHRARDLGASSPKWSSARRPTRLRSRSSRRRRICASCHRATCPSRPHRLPGQIDHRGLADPDPRQWAARRSENRDERAPTPAELADCRSPGRSQARQVERDRLCEGRIDRRHRPGPDEPPRIRAHRRLEGKGCRRQAGWASRARSAQRSRRTPLPLRRRLARPAEAVRPR